MSKLDVFSDSGPTFHDAQTNNIVTTTKSMYDYVYSIGTARVLNACYSFVMTTSTLRFSVIKPRATVTHGECPPSAHDMWNLSMHDA